MRRWAVIALMVPSIAGAQTTTDRDTAIAHIRALLTGAPSLPDRSSGFDTVSSLLVRVPDDPGNPRLAQNAATIAFTPSSGENAGTDPAAARVALQVAVAAQPGAGLVRGLLIPMGTAPGWNGVQAYGIELDVGNASGHRGDAPDWQGQALFASGGQPIPQWGGLRIDGASSFRASNALSIAGQLTGDGSALFNYGISVYKGSVRQVSFGDFSDADRSLAIFGQHRIGLDLSRGAYAQAGLRLPAGAPIDAVNAQGRVAPLLTAGPDGAVLLGGGQPVFAAGLLGLATCPSSSAGLRSGQLWCNRNVVTRVP